LIETDKPVQIDHSENDNRGENPLSPKLALSNPGVLQQEVITMAISLPMNSKAILLSTNTSTRRSMILIEKLKNIHRVKH